MICMVCDLEIVSCVYCSKLVIGDRLVISWLSLYAIAFVLTEYDPYCLR
jgi:hypothetical protein